MVRRKQEKGGNRIMLNIVEKAKIPYTIKNINKLIIKNLKNIFFDIIYNFLVFIYVCLEY